MSVPEHQLTVGFVGLGNMGWPMARNLHAAGFGLVVHDIATARQEQFAAEHPGAVAVGVDARDGRIAVEGWAEPTETSVIELARRFEDCGVAAIVYTDIARDGALSGVDAAVVAEVARQVRVPVIASGGVASLADIAALKAFEADGVAGVIIGRALYDGRTDPAAALRLAAEQVSC